MAKDPLRNTIFTVPSIVSCLVIPYSTVSTLLNRKAAPLCIIHVNTKQFSSPYIDSSELSVILLCVISESYEPRDPHHTTLKAINGNAI